MKELSLESHPFVVRLYATYADETNVYLLLSAAMGGDMYWLLSRLESMRKTRHDLVEIIGRFYTASLSLALQHIHDHDVVYRDLKPENVSALDGLMMASLISRDLKPENVSALDGLMIASLIRCSSTGGASCCCATLGWPRR
jgi:hypothetical protein